MKALVLWVALSTCSTQQAASHLPNWWPLSSSNANYASGIPSRSSFNPYYQPYDYIDFPYPTYGIPYLSNPYLQSSHNPYSFPYSYTGSPEENPIYTYQYGQPETTPFWYPVPVDNPYGYNYGSPFYNPYGYLPNPFNVAGFHNYFMQALQSYSTNYVASSNVDVPSGNSVSIPDVPSGNLVSSTEAPPWNHMSSTDVPPGNFVNSPDEGPHGRTSILTSINEYSYNDLPYPATTTMSPPTLESSTITKF
ncbi:hypothetical protein SK128_021902 [Halocaridina rubra]|uniref:Uncharacterized protein n=1 Tax=Halocaridina rubra TaxID=373956 RepID=A0AAN8X212_HALRR